jgi:glucose-1-phosphate cytidylyltransferase
MVEIGGLPIIHHIMDIYAAQGATDFVVAAGYKGEMLTAYFEGLSARRRAWHVEVVDTGAETMTGGRLLRLREWLQHEPFMLTYGDGLANIDLAALLAHHASHGRIGTLTAVHPPMHKPTLTTGRGGRVHDLADTDPGWINGGYFVFEPEVFDYLAGDQSVLEADCLSALARDGELMAYRHPGFWQCMDTLEERRHLEALWASGDAPWRPVCAGMKPGVSRFKSKASARASARRLTRVG